MASTRVGVGVTAAAPLTLGRASDLSDRLLTSIAFACPDLHHLEHSGDFRRGEPLLGALVLVGRADDPAAALDAIEAHLDFQKIIARSPRHLAAIYQLAAVEIHIATPDAFGSALLSTTGTAAHVLELARRGLSPAPFATEAEIYQSLGLPFIPAELREGV